jgi:hypothetical protein
MFDSSRFFPLIIFFINFQKDMEKDLQFNLQLLAKESKAKITDQNQICLILYHKKFTIIRFKLISQLKWISDFL